MLKSNLQSLSLVLLVYTLTHGLIPVQSVQLDSNGYYDIVVAISNKTAQDDNDDYIFNLKSGIQDLSHAIWESTHKSFAIRNVDIVIPNHWDVPTDALATTQTFLNADIRVSHEYLIPQAINPTFCGHPGQYIEIPSSFFDKKDTGPFGPPGKALLPLWGRYRWGIFEENGYPGDSVFPYFWKDWAENGAVDKDEPWKYTGCFNRDITGNYKTIDGQPCGPDFIPATSTANPFIDNIYPPTSDCRFIPDLENQTATTSLMSFTFIPSLKDFCDENTHNKKAPNRQNLFCRFKSAWEVIRQTPDWKRRDENATTDRTRVSFRVLKQTEKPLVVILSDGILPPPDSVTTTMVDKLHELFTNSTHFDVLTSVGVFPGAEKKRSFDFIYDWNTPYHNPEALTSALNASFESRPSGRFRDFGAALQDIGTIIKDRQHPNGAIVIIMKFGPEPNNLESQWPTHESEVLSVILPQNIRVYAFEGQNEARLENIANLTGGLHVSLGQSTDDDYITEIIADLQKVLEDGQVPRSKYRLAFRDSRRHVITGNGEDPFIIDVPIMVKEKVKRLLFYYHNTPDMFGSTIDVEFSEPPVSEEVVFNKYEPWGLPYIPSQTRLAEWKSSGQPLDGFSNWPISLKTMAYEVSTMINVIAELADGEMDAEEKEENVRIEVFTSAIEDDYIVDYTTEGIESLKGVAFAIYAKLEKDGHPVHNPELKVTATVWLHQDAEAAAGSDPGIKFTTINLYDDGPDKGNSDLTANDGIYSGSFMASSYFEAFCFTATCTPVYQITVSAILYADNPAESKQLVPEDQVYMRCGSSYQGCWNEAINGRFLVTTGTYRRTQFFGAADYASRYLRATRIVDLRVTNVTSDGQFQLTWTAPSVFNGVENNEVVNGLYYEIYYADDFESLLDEKFRGKILKNPADPGKEETFNSTNELQPGETAWIIMRTFTDQSSSTGPPVWSNAVFVPANTEYFSTTTTTSTPPTPPNTPSTTRRPFRPTTTTTIEPTTSTTTRSTRRPTTTSPTTEESTTPGRSTTRPPPVVVTTEEPPRWFKTTEAIVTFSLFGVGMASVIIGILTYAKITNKI